MDRGLIPRSISFIFAELVNRADLSYTLHVSYLEIYNNMGYDLLDPSHETKQLEDLPQVGQASRPTALAKPLTLERRRVLWHASLHQALCLRLVHR